MNKNKKKIHQGNISHRRPPGARAGCSPMRPEGCAPTGLKYRSITKAHWLPGVGWGGLYFKRPKGSRGQPLLPKKGGRVCGFRKRGCEAVGATGHSQQMNTGLRVADADPTMVGVLGMGGSAGRWFRGWHHSPAVGWDGGVWFCPKPESRGCLGGLNCTSAIHRGGNHSKKERWHM